MKRACIFLFYDKEGCVDGHVTFLLGKLRPFIDRLVFVANGELTDESRELLKRTVSPEDILVRENTGYDAGGFLDGLIYTGFEQLGEYDELILANDSVFGPVYPLEEMFSAMEARPELDFWGVTGHREIEDFVMRNNPRGHMLAHVQSYFTVFRKSVLSSECFKSYWLELPAMNSRDMVIQRHETYFTCYFSEKGFRWDTYIPVENETNTVPNSTCADAAKLLKMRCPFVKRSIFSPNADKYENTGGEIAVKVRQIIQQSSDYDFNIILDNLLRTAPLSDLMRTLNLCRVLPRDTGGGGEASALRSMAIVHLYYEDLLDESAEYMSNIPEETDIYITTPDIDPEIIREKTKSLKNRIEIIPVENRGRLAGAYLTKLRDIIVQYDVALIYHDKKTGTADIRNNIESFSYKLSENTAPSRSFARGAIKLFENEPRLGVLMPTIPNHGTFYFTLGSEWGEEDQDRRLTAQLLGQLGVNPAFADCPQPVAPFGDIYWFRVQALLPLFEYPWKLSDFPEEPCPADGTLLHAIERAPCLLAQSRGYYSSYLFNDSYVGIEHAMYSDYLRSWNVLLMKSGLQRLRHNEALEAAYGRLGVPYKQRKVTVLRDVPKAAKLRLFLKRLIPEGLYKGLVILKRKLFGPHIPYEPQGEEWEQNIKSIKDIRNAKVTASEFVPDEDAGPGCGIRLTEQECNAVSRYNRTCCGADVSDCRVSVIIPCYKHEEYIEQRIESVLAQTHPVYEIIFLDDASPDNSVETAKKALACAPCRVKYILNETNSGSVFSQWRKGLAAAEGDFLWIAESDDYCRPDFLETALLPFADEKVVISFTESAIVEEKEETGRRGADIHNYEGSDRYSCSYINSGKSEIDGWLSVNNYILNASAVVWRKQPVLDGIFASAEKYRLAGDWYSYLRVLQTGDIAYCAKPLNCYRFHKGTVRDSIRLGKEYLETAEVHDRIFAEEKPDILLKRRQRYRRELMGDVPREYRRKRALWVTSLPTKGSGGHRTVLNHVNALLEAGFECDVYFLYCQDKSPESIDKYLESVNMRCGADICTSPGQLKPPYDLAFATIWDSAEIVAAVDSRVKAYFAQDYEPWFFEAGSELEQAAEKTYHLGLKPVTIGKWLAHKIEEESGIPAEHYDFGVDTTVYSNLQQERERAVCAVFQPEKPRRYSEMVLRVFERIRELAPDIELYAFGTDKTDPRLAKAGVTELGIVSITELNALYNRCTAGLCISRSNPSRIPFEMMASGLCVVEIDAENNRYDYPEDVVTLAELDEEKIAKALIDLVNSPEKSAEISRKGAEFMKPRSLEMENTQFVEAVNRMLR